MIDHLPRTCWQALGECWAGACRPAGRIDLYGRWLAIWDRWVNAFRNREVVQGLSLMHNVGAEDEWCAEAYMETDYSTLTQADFEKEVKQYVAFRILDETPDTFDDPTA